MPLTPLNSNNSLTQNLSQTTDMFRELYGRTITEIFKDDSGVQRVLIGKGPNGFYGLKVSQDGIDVYDATDAQLIFNSSQNVFKVASTGTLTIPVTTGVAGGLAASVNVNHGLSYIPATLVYGQSGAAYFPLPRLIGAGAAGGVLTHTAELRVEVTTTKVFIYLFTADTSSYGPYVFRYYILQEPGT